MMFRFLVENHDELIQRCAASVMLRPHRRSSEAQLQTGIPLFLGQLERTLEAEELHHAGQSLEISGAAGGRAGGRSEMDQGATLHGKELFALEFTVDEVVHDYGDLCQAITSLACERESPFTVDEFRTLNRCLDNAIASAVASFNIGREQSIAAREAVADQRMAARMHELRSSLATATYAVAAMHTGNLPMAGATGMLLRRSLASMRDLIGGPTFEEVQAGSDARL